MSKQTQKQELPEPLYNPSTASEKYEDIVFIAELMERHGIPTENFNEHGYFQLFNHVLNTCKKWDKFFIEQALNKDNSLNDE